MADRETLLKTDETIRQYLNNNEFVEKSSWANAAITQLFQVDMISDEQFADYWSMYTLDGRQEEPPSTIWIRDVVSFGFPADRFDFVGQNLFNQNRNIFTGVTRDQFRLKIIDNSNHTYRKGFSSIYGLTNSSGLSYFGKMLTRRPINYYYNLLVRQIKKDSTDGLYKYTVGYILKHCVTENINDIDFSVEKMNFLTTEITGKFKQIYYL